MRRLLLAVLLASSIGGVCAQTVKSPPLTPGDSWTYETTSKMRGTQRSTHETMTLTRVAGHLLTMEVHPAGTPGPGTERLIGPEWSRVRSVNGRQTTVNQPLSFPLSVGKSWTLAFSETNPANRAHVREQWQMQYRAVDWEDITVTAGTFHALKIEGDGTWTADLPSNVLVARGRAPNGNDVAVATKQGPRVVSGRYFKAFWYVPEIRRWVRSEEDYYDNNGVQTQHLTEQLEAYAMVEADPSASIAPPAPTPAKPRHAKIHRAPPEPHVVSPKAKPPSGPSLQETRAIRAPGSIPLV